MNSLFCYCCQGLLNIFPQNNKGKRVMWNIQYNMEYIAMRRTFVEFQVYHKQLLSLYKQLMSKLICDQTRHPTNYMSCYNVFQLVFHSVLNIVTKHSHAIMNLLPGAVAPQRFFFVFCEICMGIYA